QWLIFDRAVNGPLEVSGNLLHPIAHLAAVFDHTVGGVFSLTGHGPEIVGCLVGHPFELVGGLFLDVVGRRPGIIGALRHLHAPCLAEARICQVKRHRAGLVQSGRSGGSLPTALLRVTVSAISSGTAKKAPIGPQNQVQKAIARNTAKGLSSRRLPINAGVMNWPSTVTMPI